MYVCWELKFMIYREDTQATYGHYTNDWFATMPVVFKCMYNQQFIREQLQPVTDLKENIIEKEGLFYVVGKWL